MGRTPMPRWSSRSAATAAIDVVWKLRIAVAGVLQARTKVAPICGLIIRRWLIRGRRFATREKQQCGRNNNQ